MGDPASILAERIVQPLFRKLRLFSLLLLAALILAFACWLGSLPNRIAAPPRDGRVNFQRIELDPAGFAPLRLAGAWRLTANDPRFGGVSALAVDQAGLIALTDSGVVIRFARPTGAYGVARIADLPSGAGDPGFKRNRDSEALVRDPLARGWWVAFENRHQLWLYDPGFNRALERIDLGQDRWPANAGVEAMVSDGRGLMLFAEHAAEVIRLDRTRARRSPLAHPSGRISDATRLPDGRVLLLAAETTPFGFSNALVSLEPGDGAGRSIALGLGPLDNAEALAAEPIPGGTRLWLMTDDNFRWPMRTLLVALDLLEKPAGAGFGPTIKR